MITTQILLDILNRKTPKSSLIEAVGELDSGDWESICLGADKYGVTPILR
jgi:hypothetical protein